MLFNSKNKKHLTSDTIIQHLLSYLFKFCFRVRPRVSNDKELSVVPISLPLVTKQRFPSKTQIQKFKESKIWHDWDCSFRATPVSVCISSLEASASPKHAEDCLIVCNLTSFPAFSAGILCCSCPPLNAHTSLPPTTFMFPLLGFLIPARDPSAWLSQTICTTTSKSNMCC